MAKKCIKKANIIRMTAIIMTPCLLLCTFACASNNSKKVEPLKKDMYEKATIETVTVQKGDILPQFSITLSQNPFEHYNYQVEGKDLELETLYVSVGDYVEAGDILVAFKSEKISKEVNDVSKKLEQDKLLLTHTQKLKGIVESMDTSKMNEDEKKSYQKKLKDYDDTIAMIEEDIKLKKAELSEKQSALDKCFIKAKESGTITYVNKMLLNGQVPQNADIITESCGEMLFFAEISDEYTFNVGDKYEAESPTMTMNLEVSEIEKDETSQKTKVYFRPEKSDISFVEGEKFTITIEKDPLIDVVYVDAKAVSEAENGRYYVILVKDNLYREAKYIEVEGFVDGKAVIKSGLEYGDEVALK